METTVKKDIALAFQKLVVAGKIQDAYDKYVHPNFYHHNPYFPGDRQSLLKAMEENAKQFPNKSFEAKRILEDGDIVAIHSLLTLSSDSPQIAVVHIFRFEENKIIEEWDVGQQIPQDSPNMNGMF